MIRIRPRFPQLALVAMALLAHLLMPLIAMPMAAMSSADPLARAFCGPLSPAMLASIKRNAPELFELLRQEAQQNDKTACADCQIAHAGAPLAPSAALIATGLRGAHEPVTARALAIPQVALVMLPQLRGPPARSA
jgi:hypothetical protein